MAIDKINIQEKADNPNKKALLARLGVPQDESLSAQETNKLVGKTNELVDKTNELNQKFDAYKPVNAFNFKGNVATYANLPTTNLTKDDAYGVIADGLVYIYNGTSFPTSGNGLNLGLKPTSDSKVAAGNELAVSGGEVYDYLSDYDKTEETLDKLIKGWVIAEAIAISNPTYSADGNISGAVITWGDGDVGSISNVVVSSNGITSIRYNRSNGDYATMNVVYDNKGEFQSQEVIITKA